MLGPWLDQDVTRAVALAGAAAAAVVIGWREHRRRATIPDIWSPFWAVTAALFTVLSLGRLLDLGESLVGLGRDHGRRVGWYAARRGLQAALLVSILGAWLATAGLAIWQFPRRHRFLLASIVVLATLSFVVMRLVSLHHLDAVLHRRDVAGVRIGTWLELGLAALAIVTFVMTHRRALQNATSRPG